MKGGLILTNLEMNQNIAEFIGSYCTKWNLSISKFADKCGISYMVVKRIMAGTVMKIDVYTIMRISEITRTPIMEILGIDRENLDLYKRISHASSHDKRIITHLMNTLEKLHVSGKECREIPCLSLISDRKSYLLDGSLFSDHHLDYSKMERITYRSSFAEGFIYMGFHLPDNRLHPCFHRGDALLVMNDDPAEGEIGAFAWKDEGYIRLIFRHIHRNGRFVELLPIAGRGRSYVIDTENMSDLMNWVTIGVVTGIIR